MNKQLRLSSLATLAALAALCAVSGSARAADVPKLNQIHVTYHGGPLLAHVKVVTLFWGQEWDGSPQRDHLNGFFQALFDDGRFVANLSQYSAGGYQISDGQLFATATDPSQVPARVTDQQVRGEIGAEIQAGAIPFPDTDILYVVFTPPHVIVDNGDGGTSDKDFVAYHSAAIDQQGDWSPYIIAPTPSDNMRAGLKFGWGIDNDGDAMTQAVSHELAEAITDPEPSESTGGWYDTSQGMLGEIGDLPDSLYASGQIRLQDLFDTLQGGDGTQYLVQRVWSEQDRRPVAFADARLR